MTGSSRERLEEVAKRVLENRERLEFSTLAERARRRKVEAFQDGAGLEAVQVEVQYFFDSGRSGPVRIIVAVDDGGLRALAPLTRDTVVVPA